MASLAWLVSLRSETMLRTQCWSLLMAGWPPAMAAVISALRSQCLSSQIWAELLSYCYCSMQEFTEASNRGWSRSTIWAILSTYLVKDTSVLWAWMWLQRCSQLMLSPIGPSMCPLWPSPCLSSPESSRFSLPLCLTNLPRHLPCLWVCIYSQLRTLCFLHQLYSQWLSLSIWTTITTYHRISNLFLTVLEAEKSKSEASADLVCGAFWLVDCTFLLHPQEEWNHKTTLWGFFYNSPNPIHDPFTSQRPHLLTQSPWWLGFNIQTIASTLPKALHIENISLTTLLHH
jgi:hypothetical protein